MPRICTICGQPRRDEVDEALRVGEPLRDIAKRYRTSPAALFRHKKHAIPATLVKHGAVEQMPASTFERFQNLHRATTAILEEAQCSQNHAVALQAISRMEKQIAFEARLLGELSEPAKAAIGINLKPADSPGRVNDNHEVMKVLTNEELEMAIKIAKKLEARRQELAALAG
jgi:hypothetical protein